AVARLFFEQQVGDEEAHEVGEAVPARAKAAAGPDAKYEGIKVVNVIVSQCVHHCWNHARATGRGPFRALIAVVYTSSARIAESCWLTSVICSAVRCGLTTVTL